MVSIGRLSSDDGDIRHRNLVPGGVSAPLFHETPIVVRLFETAASSDTRKGPGDLKMVR